MCIQFNGKKSYNRYSQWLHKEGVYAFKIITGLRVNKREMEGGVTLKNSEGEN